MLSRQRAGGEGPQHPVEVPYESGDTFAFSPVCRCCLCPFIQAPAAARATYCSSQQHDCLHYWLPHFGLIVYSPQRPDALLAVRSVHQVCSGFQVSSSTFWGTSGQNCQHVLGMVSDTKPVWSSAADKPVLSRGPLLAGRCQSITAARSVNVDTVPTVLLPPQRIHQPA